MRFGKREADFWSGRSTFKRCCARSTRWWVLAEKNLPRAIRCRLRSVLIGATPSSGRGRPRTPLPEAWSDRPGPLPGADDGLGGAFGGGAPAAGKLPLPALSPEIERLLQGAEDRSVLEQGPGPASQPPVPSEPPSPDEEVDAVLPAEVLAALDEPLDENDDDLQSDSGLSTGAANKKVTTGAGAVTSSGTSHGTSGGDHLPPVPRPIATMRKTYPDLTPDEVFKLAIHDVSRSFIASMNKEGYVQPSLDELTKMRIHGVDAFYVQGLRKAGYNNLTIGELVKTRIHGATPAFAQEVSAAGFGKASVDDLVKMRIHGVTPDMVRELRELGYNDLRVDEVVKLRIHGATPAFIREMRELGYKDLALERRRADARSTASRPNSSRNSADSATPTCRSRTGEDADPRRHAGVHQGRQRRGLQEHVRGRPRGLQHPRPPLAQEARLTLRLEPNKNSSAWAKRPAQAPSEWEAPSSTVRRSRRGPSPAARRMARKPPHVRHRLDVPVIATRLQPFRRRDRRAAANG